MDPTHDFTFIIMNARDRIGGVQLTSDGPPRIIESNRTLENDNLQMKVLNEAGEDCSVEYKVVECYFEVSDGKLLPVGAHEFKELSATNGMSCRNCDCLATEKQTWNASLLYKQNNCNYKTPLTTECVLPSNCACIDCLNLKSEQEAQSLVTFNDTGLRCKNCSPVEKMRRMEIRVEDFRLAKGRRDIADTVSKDHSLEPLSEDVSGKNGAATPILAHSPLAPARGKRTRNCNISTLPRRSRRFRGRKTEGYKDEMQNGSSEVLFSKYKNSDQAHHHNHDERFRHDMRTRNEINFINSKSSNFPSSGLELRKTRLMRQNVNLKVKGRLRRGRRRRNSRQEVKVNNEKPMRKWKNQSDGLLEVDCAEDTNGMKLLQNDMMEYKQERLKHQRTLLSSTNCSFKSITDTGEPEKVSVTREISNGQSVKDPDFGYRPRNNSDLYNGSQLQTEFRCRGMTDWDESDSSCDVLLLPELPADEFDSKPSSCFNCENELPKPGAILGNDVHSSISKRCNASQNPRQQRLEQVRRLLVDCIRIAESKLGYRTTTDELTTVCHSDKQKCLRLDAVSKNEGEKAVALEKEVIERNKILESFKAKISARMALLQELEISYKKNQENVESERKRLSNQKVKLKDEWKKLTREKYRLKTMKKMIKFQFSTNKNFNIRMRSKRKLAVTAVLPIMNTVDIHQSYDEMTVATAISTSGTSLASDNMENLKCVASSETDNMPNVEASSSCISSFNAASSKSSSEFYGKDLKCELKMVDQLSSSDIPSTDLEISDSSLRPSDENFVGNSGDTSLFIASTSSTTTCTVEDSLPALSCKVEAIANSPVTTSCPVIVSLPITSACIVCTAPSSSKAEPSVCHLSPSKSRTCKLSSVSCNQILPLKTAAGQLLLQKSVCMMPSISLVPVTAPYTPSRCELTSIDDSHSTPAHGTQRTSTRENRSKTRRS